MGNKKEEMFGLLKEGYNRKEIAQKTGMCYKTVCNNIKTFQLPTRMEEVVSLFKEGLSREEIEKKTGMFYSNICRIIREAGLSKNKKTLSEKTKKKIGEQIKNGKLKKKEKEKIIELFLKGKERQFISTNTSVNYDKVCKVIRENKKGV